MSLKTAAPRIPAELLPYEKFEKYGEASLTDAELLSVILRTGSRDKNALQLSAEVLSMCPYAKGLEGIYELSAEKLRSITGIGKVKAIQIRCIGELSKRIAESKARQKLDFRCASSIADYYMERLRCEKREMVFCMMLDTRASLICDECISIGTVNASLLSPREIFTRALECRAVSIVLVHNHPSGDPTPSEEDIQATDTVKKAGEIIGISLLDHIIIGQKKYVSILN